MELEEEKQLYMFDDIKEDITKDTNYINQYKAGLLDDSFELSISNILQILLNKDIRGMTFKELEQYTRCVKVFKDLLDNQQNKQYNLQFKAK